MEKKKWWRNLAVIRRIILIAVNIVAPFIMFFAGLLAGGYKLYLWVIFLLSHIRLVKWQKSARKKSKKTRRLCGGFFSARQHPIFYVFARYWSYVFGGVSGKMSAVSVYKISAVARYVQRFLVTVGVAGFSVGKFFVYRGRRGVVR